MQNSCLRSESAIKIVEAMIYKNIRVIDFSLNPLLSEKFYERLAELFGLYKFDLAVLKLEGNQMKDRNCDILTSKI